MTKPRDRKVRCWVQVGSHYIEDNIELPDDCFDDQGGIIPGDAAEFVEKWINDDLRMEYGAYIVGSSEDPRK